MSTPHGFTELVQYRHTDETLYQHAQNMTVQDPCVKAWTFRPSTSDDIEDIAELRARVLRPDLERLGRYNGEAVRQRLRDHFIAEHTRIIDVDSRLAGCVALRPDGNEFWLEHFYLADELHGRGIGTEVLDILLDEADAKGLPVRLNVLVGSRAQKLYAAHGFVVDSADAVDAFMTRSVLPRESRRD